MKTISNKQLTIQVSPHGAELCSIVANGKEYLWQADPAFWRRHSPVLFPIVGSVWENEYRNEGVPYTLTQHGFARDMEFTLVAEKEDEVRYRLVSNEETLQKYPFPFCLEIGYRIQGKQIEVFFAEDAEKMLKEKNQRAILVRIETSPEDHLSVNICSHSIDNQ